MDCLSICSSFFMIITMMGIAVGIVDVLVTVYMK